MYKAVLWCYGRRDVKEFDTFEEAKSWDDGSDEYFFECILDENDVIVYDNKTNVIGIETSDVGKKYQFD